VCYCSGDLVEALLRSGAHAYVEFKAVEASAIYARGALRAVPGSRADVFASRELSATDKRALMRALKAAAEPAGAEGSSSGGIFADAGGASFAAALAAAGLSAEPAAAVLHALALADGDVPVAAGVAALQRCALRRPVRCDAHLTRPIRSAFVAISARSGAMEHPVPS
jgi:hypothetical protein